jgi:O-antigen/teichoic acid export membrane protein
LLRNLLTLYLAELLAKGLALAVYSVHLFHTLGEGTYGEMVFALSVFFVLNLAMEAGLGPYGAKEAAARPERTRMLGGAVTLLRGALLLGELLVLAALALVLDKPWESRLLVLLYGTLLLSGPLLTEWAFQAREQMTTVALLSLGRQLMFAATVWCTVRGPQDAWRVPVADGLALLLCAAVHQVLFRARFGRPDFAAARPALRAILSQAVPMAFGSVTWAARLFAPPIVLGLYNLQAETGRFGAGHQLVVAAHTFVWLYFFNLLPAISRTTGAGGRPQYHELMRRSHRLVVPLALGGAMAGTVLAPLVVPRLYAPGVVLPLQWMVWMLAIAFLSGHQRFSLIAFGWPRAEWTAATAGAGVSVLGCLVHGSALTAERAAMVFVLAEAVTYAAAWWLLRRRLSAARSP